MLSIDSSFQGLDILTILRLIFHFAKTILEQKFCFWCAEFPAHPRLAWTQPCSNLNQTQLEVLVESVFNKKIMKNAYS